MTTYASGKPEPSITRLIELLPPKSHVLDIGCGEGRNAIPLARANMHVEGWDKSVEELSILKARAEEEKLPIKVVSCDMRDFRVGYDRWDAVLTILCMHFLTPTEAKERLACIRANLKPGGYHAMVVFTGNGSLAKVRSDRFYPSVDELMRPYENWNKAIYETGKSFCLQNGPQGQKLENERLTLLARKPQ